MSGSVVSPSHSNVSSPKVKEEVLYSRMGFWPDYNPVVEHLTFDFREPNILALGFRDDSGNQELFGFARPVECVHAADFTMVSESCNDCLSLAMAISPSHSRSLSTFVPFSICGLNHRVFMSRLRGRAVRRASHDQPVWGAFVLLQKLALLPVSCIRHEQSISPSHHAPVIFVSRSTK